MNSSTGQPNPYAPPTAEVADAQGEGIAAVADRGTRFGAAMLDGVIYILMYMPIVVNMMKTAGTSMGGGIPDTQALMLQAMTGSGALLTLVLFLAWAGYTIYLVNRNGQTIGKKLLGIKVVRTDGSRAGLGRIFWLRNFVNGLPSLIPFVGYVYVLVDHLFIFSEKRQCLHDKIADTIVVQA